MAITAFEVADWRRRVFALYTEVRVATDLFAAHDLWRRGRDRLFAEHPSSPLMPDDLADFTGLPVKDALAGLSGGTYGGGRYLLDTIKGADLGSGRAPDSLVLDFNFAYNPSCAYDPAWACPLAQAGNRVAVEIPVGERYSGVY